MAGFSIVRIIVWKKLAVLFARRADARGVFAEPAFGGSVRPKWVRGAAYHHDHGGLWKLGEPRGSTPPVRVGDEYFAFFHSRSAKGEYHVGFYSFEAKPPFRVLRWPSVPCLSPFGTETSDECKGLKVLFPGGVVLADGEWLMAYGMGDKACCLARYRHAELLEAFKESSRALPVSQSAFAKL